MGPPVLLFLICCISSGYSRNFVPVVSPPRLEVQIGDSALLECMIPPSVLTEGVLWIRLSQDALEMFNGATQCSILGSGSGNASISGSGSESGDDTSTSGSGMSAGDGISGSGVGGGDMNNASGPGNASFSGSGSGSGATSGSVSGSGVGSGTGGGDMTVPNNASGSDDVSISGSRSGSGDVSISGSGSGSGDGTSTSGSASGSGNGGEDVTVPNNASGPDNSSISGSGSGSGDGTSTSGLASGGGGGDMTVPNNTSGPDNSSISGSGSGSGDGTSTSGSASGGGGGDMTVPNNASGPDNSSISGSGSGSGDISISGSGSGSGDGTSTSGLASGGGGGDMTVPNNASGPDNSSISGSGSGSGDISISGSGSGSGDGTSTSGSASGGGGGDMTVPNNTSGPDNSSISGSGSGSGDGTSTSGSASGGGDMTVPNNASGPDNSSISGSDSGSGDISISGSGSGSGDISISGSSSSSSGGSGGRTGASGSGSGMSASGSESSGGTRTSGSGEIDLSGSGSGSGDSSSSDNNNNQMPQQTVNENIIGNGSVLNFSTIRFGDEGQYVCIVLTDSGNCTSNYSTISVSPESMISPSNETYTSGSTAELICTGMGGPGNRFHWLFQEEFLSNSNADVNITMNDSISLLNLLRVNASDGGEYSCIISNAAGNDTSSTFLFISPYFTSQPEEVMGPNGSRVVLICEAEAFPPPEYQWGRSGGQEIRNGVVGVNKSMLIFDPIVFGDEGGYFCNVTSQDNTIQSETITATISPEESVMVNSSITNSRVGETVNLVCLAQGGPGNQFTWTRVRDGVVIGNQSELNVDVVNASDGSVYTCTVTNLAGSDNETAVINVAPTIMISPIMKMNVSAGETFMLTCRASGYPIPTILWFHNRSLLDETEETNINISMQTFENTRLVSSVLTIHEARLNNSGNYSCTARSDIADYQEEDSVEVEVVVQAMPEQPQNVTASRVTSREINLTWVEPHDNNAPILGYLVRYMEPDFVGGDLAREVNTSVEMATITDLSPGVDYEFTVTAYNQIGSSSPSDTLTVRTLDEVPDSAPGNVTASALNSTSIMVRWEVLPPADRNGIIAVYEVMYQPMETFGDAIGTEMRNVSGLETSVVLDGLEEFVNYTISVQAYTSLGPGPESEQVTARTNEDAPSDSPVNVTALANSSTSIMVTWGPVPEIDQNGIITVYEVMYQPMETFGDAIGTEMRNVSGLETSVVLDGLEEFVNYTISVQAYTSVGPGPESEQVTTRTNEDAPSSSPVNVTALANSSTSIMVTWGPVPEIDQNGIITEYEVMYEPLETFNNTIGIDMVTVRAPNTSVLLNGLQEYVNYSIRVRASTSVGPSDYSSPVQERTNEDVPRIPPTNVAINTVSSTSIMVTWGPVPDIDQNGIITEYEVMYEPLETFGGNITTQRMNVTVPEMSVTLTKLQEFVFYNISVRAYTSVGAGPFSEDMTERTDDDTPSSSPVNVTALVNSSTSIMVTWGPVPEIDQNGIITEYEVMYEPLETFGGSISTLTVNVSDPDLSTLLMELQEFVNYSVSVRAYTIIGPGPYSDEEMARTNEDVPARPPVNTTATVLSSTSIMVTWDPVPDIDQNGIITEYEVMYEPLETFNNTIGIDMVTVRAPNTSVLLNGLQEYVNYSIRVRASTSVGPSNYSSPVQERTNEDVPRIPPTNVAINTVSSTSIMVTWGPVPAIDQNGIITEYEVMYEPLETFGGNISTQRMNVTAPEMSVTLTKLQEFVFYNISVRAYTSVGAGSFSEEMTERTNEDVPSGFPQSVNASVLSSTVVMVTWEAVPRINQNGIIRMYEVLLQPSGGQMAVSRNFSELSGNVTEVEEAVQYNISVRAYTMEGPGPYSTPLVQVMTNEDFPGLVSEPPEVPVNTINATSAVISWDPPSDANGVITLYTVNLVVISSDASTFDSTSSQGRRRKRQTSGDMMVIMKCIKGGENNADRNITVGGDQTSLSLVDLSPYSIYGFKVQAATKIGPGGFSSSRKFRTTEGRPSRVTNLAATALTSSSIRVMWGRPQCPYGNITRYIVHYRLSDVAQTRNIDSSGYTSINTTTLQHTISELTASRTYAIHVQAVVTPVIGRGPDLLGQIDTEELVRTQDSTNSTTPVIVAIILALILVVIVVAIIIIIFVYWRYRKTKYAEIIPANNNVELVQASHIKDRTPDAHEEETPFMMCQPVLIKNFAKYVSQHHHDDNQLFIDEYSNVEPNHSPTVQATQNPDNTFKNRYANITAYDHSRVKLQKLPEQPNSDYINANYLDGYKSKNCFIAAQGPVPASVADFWRMIWEQNVGYIVMVTNCEEKGRIKCHKYWPDEIGKCLEFESFKVYIQESLVLAEYTIRTFSLQREGCKEERVIHQYHFTVWPDHGVPEYPGQLLHFVRKVMQEEPMKNGPLVVHCSAGVGRTGTFITLFTQLQRIEAEGTVDIFGFVRRMRQRRCYMVQTQDQYVFLHDALLEAIECDVGEVAARDLAKQFRKMSTDGLLEAEFSKVSTSIHNRILKTVASMSSNTPKNRYKNPDILPYDKTRVKLDGIPNGTDYINASTIDGYHKLSAYIATQGPLPDTTNDFWRMVWEQNSSTIVMLTKEKEGGRLKCHKYWPDQGALTCSNLQVVHHSETDYADYTMREFKLVDTKDGSSKQVRQYFYKEWPEGANKAPENSAGLIDLIGQVQKWQRNSGDYPVVVHCSNGCGRTGTYIAVCILLERLKTEGVVDVFHTVRTLRLQRPNMVSTLAQYEFCYRAVLEFLDSFELYSNFK